MKVLRSLVTVPSSLLFMMCVCVLTSCDHGPASQPALTEAALEQGEARLPVNQALVLYTAGDVAGGLMEVNKEEWKILGAGDLLCEKSGIVAQVDSECELQLGDTGVVHIGENTEVAVREILLSSGKKKICFDMTQGSLLCKVEKLSGVESFRVKTRTAVMGVRGTEFGVTVTEKQGTTLAVRTGKVGLLPRSLDLEELGVTKDDDAALLTLMDEIKDAAQVVGPDQEAVVTEQDLEATQVEAREIKEQVRQVRQKTGMTAEERAHIRKKIRQTRDLVKRKIKRPVRMGPERRNQLRRIDGLKRRHIPLSSGTREKGEEARAVSDNKAEKLVRIRVQVEPRTAVVMLDGRAVGRGRFQGLFAQGEELEFVFRDRNHEAQHLPVKVDARAQKVFRIRLVPEKPEMPKSEELEDKEKELASLETSEEKELRRKTREALEEKEKLESALAEKKTKDISSKKEEYETAVVMFGKPSGFPIVGDMCATDKQVIGVDSTGTVFAVDHYGQLLWRLGSKGGNNKYIVLQQTQGKVYYAGASEILIINAQTGKLIQRFPSARISGELWGRRFFLEHDALIVPSDNSLQISSIRPRTDSRYVPIPSTYYMTVEAFADELMWCDDRGIIRVLNLQNGAIKPHAVTLPFKRPAARAVFPPKSLCYLADQNGILVCLSDHGKQLSWQTTFPAGGAEPVALAVHRSGIFVYAGGKMQAYTHQGKRLFPPLEGVSAPPLTLPGKVIVARNNKTLEFRDQASGRVLRRTQLESLVTSRPLPMTRYIVVGTDKGEVLFIHPERIPELSGKK